MSKQLVRSPKSEVRVELLQDTVSEQYLDLGPGPGVGCVSSPPQSRLIYFPCVPAKPQSVRHSQALGLRTRQASRNGIPDRGRVRTGPLGRG